MKSKLLIFGSGAHARKVFYYADRLGYDVVGFIDESSRAISPILGLKMFPPASPQLLGSGASIFVAVGQRVVRKRIMEQYISLGWNLPTIIHPSAWVAPDVKLGAGVLVAAGAVVETASAIGQGAIIDIGAIVDHNCCIPEYSHIKPGEICLPHTVWNH